MKNLLQFLFAGLMLAGVFLVPASVTAQSAANDSCVHATVIPVLPYVVYQRYLMNRGGIEANMPHNYPCNPTQLPRDLPVNDVWFQTTPTTAGLIWHIKRDPLNSGSPVFEFYHGTCNNLVYDGCRYWDYGPDSLTYIFNFPAGTTHYIRFFGYDPNDPFDEPIFLSAEEKFPPKRVISKRLTGTWAAANSWVGNVAPNYNDTVIIDDGSTITALGSEVRQIAKLIVGQQDTTLQARLNISSNVFNTTIPDSLVVNRKDTMQMAGGQLHLGGNLRINGGLSVLQFGMLFFDKDHDQVLEGSGSLTKGPAPSGWQLTLNKPSGTLFQRLPLDLYSNNSLSRGLVNSSAPIRFKAASSSFTPIIYIKAPAFLHPDIAIQNTINRFNALEVLQPDTSLHLDSVLHLNPYLASGQPVIFSVQRLGRDTVLISGNRTINQIGDSQFDIYFDGILKGNPEDTLFVGTDYAYTPTNYFIGNNPKGIIVGTLVFNPALKLDNILPDTNYFPLISNGIMRQISVTNSKQVLAAGQTVAISLPGITASGPCLSPLSFVQPVSVFKITSNRDTLPAACKLKLYYTGPDHMLGSLRNYCIAQGPGPAGPWTNVSHGTRNADGESVWTSGQIDFRNGNYFCLASLQKSNDLTFDWAQTAPPALIGPGMPPHTLRMQVYNNGLFRTFGARVHWSINTPVPITGTDTLTFPVPLDPTDSAVLSLNPTALINFPYTGKYLYTLSLDSNDNNQTTSRKDTVHFYMDNRPKTAPFVQTFDSTAAYFLPAQYRSNPPNMHEWRKDPDLYPQTITPSGSNKVLMANNVNLYGGENAIFTEPVLLQAGTTFVGGKMAGAYPNIGSQQQSGDSVQLQISTDTGRTYKTIGRLLSTQLRRRTTPGTLLPFADSVHLTAPALAHMKILLHHQSGPRYYFVLHTDSIRYSLTRFLRPVGLPVAFSRQAFTLYPNPATHTVNITTLPSQSAPLFYNTVGQLLQVPLQSKPGLWQADLQSLPKGLYLVQYAGQVSKVVKE